MVNPYEPPKFVVRKSFFKRLTKASAMALAEYRAGLKREGLDTWSHLQAWLGLIVTVLLMLFVAIAVVVLALVNIGFFR